MIMEKIKIIVQSDGQNITPFLKIGEKEYQGMNFRDNDTVMSSVVFVSENIISNLITLGFKGLVELRHTLPEKDKGVTNGSME